jgi:hypothetical protein
MTVRQIIEEVDHQQGLEFCKAGKILTMMPRIGHRLDLF